jgi:hypothetical protein
MNHFFLCPKGDLLIQVWLYFFQLSKAENGSLNEEKDSLDKQFVNKDTVWSILNCIKRSPLGQRKKWSYKTGDLLKEVQFKWTFLWQVKKKVTF